MSRRKNEELPGLSVRVCVFGARGTEEKRSMRDVILTSIWRIPRQT